MLTYIWFCPHALIVSRIAALEVSSPTVQVALSTRLEVVVDLVDDMLVRHVPHHATAAKTGQSILLPLLVDENLQIIVTFSSVPGIWSGKVRKQ